MRRVVDTDVVSTPAPGSVLTRLADVIDADLSSTPAPQRGGGGGWRGGGT